MYRAIVWRHGIRIIENGFETISEAARWARDGTKENLHFFECVIDENDIIVYSDSEAVGSYQNGIGKKYEWNI